MMMHDGLELDESSQQIFNATEGEDSEEEDTESTEGVDEVVPVIADTWTIHEVVVAPTEYSQICSRRRQHEWEATRHDRCSSSLRDATWKWVERSGYIATGDSVRVTDTSHAAFDSCGEVLEYNMQEHIATVKLVEPVDGRQIGNIHRTMITKIHGTRNNSIARDAIGVQNFNILDNFVYEANLEIDRCSRFAFTTTDSGADRDQSGRRVFIGDLVSIVEEHHDYNGWIIMMSGIKPGGMLRCSLGMPPSRFRRTPEDDEQARRDRPLNRNYLVRVQHCNVWGPNP